MTTLRECYYELVTALSNNVLETSQALYSRNIIPESIVQKMLLISSIPDAKASELISAVTNVVKINSDKYHDFMDVLRENPIHNDIISILNTAYKKSKSK